MDIRIDRKEIKRNVNTIRITLEEGTEYDITTELGKLHINLVEGNLLVQPRYANVINLHVEK